MGIIAHQLKYIHPDREVLFSDISFSLQDGQKAAFIGNNGSGKSTLLQVVKGNLLPASGEVVCSLEPYYVPQHFGQYGHLTVAEALQVDKKLKALHAILQGDTSVDNYDILADDWDMEERIAASLGLWGLNYINVAQKMESLSGGEKTRIFLAGMAMHHPEIILMDEPTNHLDYAARKKLYEYIVSSKATVMLVSHDRTLLNLMPSIYELYRKEIVFYPGNYEFYKNQKEQEIETLHAKMEEASKQLRQARKTVREVAERKQKHEERGKKHNLKKGVGKMAMDTLKDKAEKSGTKLRDKHVEKIESIAENLAMLRAELPAIDAMKTDFNSSMLHAGKVLIEADKINYKYCNHELWEVPLSFKIRSGERIAIKGKNGSGKTTLLKLITGLIQPSTGVLSRSDFQYIYLDQDYSLIKNDCTVLEQVLQFNATWQEHEIKTILNRFLFTFDTWDKPCLQLSGGEKMKLALCCLMIGGNTPDLFILDEPANNIDIRNIEMLTDTVKEYKGTLLVISHDEYFLEQIGIDYSIDLDESRKSISK